MRKDLVFALRTLRRSPFFAAMAVLSLALGIGANTAIFSLLDQVVLRSLPVADPERLAVLHTDYGRNGTSSSDNHETVFSYPMYRALSTRDQGVSLIARSSAGVTLLWQGSARPVTAEIVSGNFFQVLGVKAALGRLFTPADDGAPGASPVVVLDHSYWTSGFGASPAVLNQKVLINGHPMTVIGVANASFHGVLSGDARELYVPIAMQKAVRPTWDVLEDQTVRWLTIFARLKPGLSLQQAQAATDVAYRAVLQDELPREGHMSAKDTQEFLNHKVQLRPASQGLNALRRQWEKPLTALMVMVGLVLLIACANIAGLMLARATGRRREIAVRLAMGAGRWALARQLLVEGLLVALAGGAAGLLVAVWSNSALLGLMPRDYAGPWLQASLNYRVLFFSLGISAVAGLLFGLAPALQSTRADLAVVLKDQAANVISGGGAARFRQALVTAEIALSLVLVVGAGLFSSSLSNLLRVDLGFRTQRLLMFNVNGTLTRPQLPAAVQFYHDLNDRLAAIPGVIGVAASDTGPYSNSGRGGNLTIEGYTPKPNEYVGASLSAVNPGFFRALGIPVRAGREFTDRDTGAAPKVVIVNETFAKKYFGQANPIGRRLMIGGSNKPVYDREIVGVAADVRQGLHDPAKEVLYHPYAQWRRQPERLTWYVRTGGDETAASAAIRRVVREADANVPVGNITPVDVAVRESIYTERLIAALSGAFGALAT
ncbi:MAG TPA: ABC transporter permease, partial [Bryobacteraceae bacterium]